MTSSIQLDRRAVLKGLAGVTLALPLLEAMGKGGRGENCAAVLCDVHPVYASETVRGVR
jgi:hypothetical protein